MLVPLHFPPWMSRVRSQEAFVTIAGGFGVDHAEQICRLGMTKCRRIIVPTGMKEQVLQKLDLMGVNGYTLEIGDSTIETIAADINEATQEKMKREG